MTSWNARSPWIICAPLLLSMGCGGSAGSAPPPGPPDHASPAEPAATATAEVQPPAETGPPTLPERGDPANHYLASDVLFAAGNAFSAGYLSAYVVKQLGPRGADGKASFYRYSHRKEYASKHFWQHRPAKPEELAVGALVVACDIKNQLGIYVPPESVKQAYERNWFITRIVSTVPLGEGYVWVSGGYRVAPQAIRLLEDDSSLRIALSGAEDGHYLQEGHWFVSTGPLPDKGYGSVALAVPTRPANPFEGGEGRFVRIGKGSLVLTQHAWQTRVATQADLRKGQRVFALNHKSGGVYQAPASRQEALFKGWWAPTIEDTSELAKGIVGVSGGYRVSVKGLRVLR